MGLEVFLRIGGAVLDGDGLHDDGAGRTDGTGMFAIAASDTELGREMRDGNAVVIVHHLEGAGGAMFRAGAAVVVVTDGDATLGMENGVSDPGVLLFDEGEKFQGTGGADFGATLAVEFAKTTVIGDTDGQAVRRRTDHAGRTGGGAEAAADATAREILERSGAGRTNGGSTIHGRVGESEPGDGAGRGGGTGQECTAGQAGRPRVHQTSTRVTVNFFSSATPVPAFSASAR